MRALPWTHLRGEPGPKPGTNNGTISYGRLENRTYSSTKSIPVWVYEMSADFSLSGSTAQSAHKRDFYTRNFNQPNYMFLGQTHNEVEYSQLIEFVREAQRQCVFGQSIMRFMLDQNRGANETILRPGQKNSDRRDFVRGQKGRRPPIGVQGYVTSVRRAHERWVNAPEYQIEFTIQRSLVGPFKDEEVSYHVLPTNWDAFVKRDGTGFVRDPDQVLLSQTGEDPGTKPVVTDEGGHPSRGNAPSLTPRNPDGTPG